MKIADMKRILSICVFILMLGVAAAQQSTNNSPDATNHTAANPFDALDATNGVTGNMIEETKAKAEKGDAEAQYRLGCAYENGQGVKTNVVEAVKWFRKAAERNYANAQYSLGVCYYFGLGVAKDTHEAVKWYSQAAQQGNGAAQMVLGVCYDNGIGVPKDEDEAAKWYRKAYENPVAVSYIVQVIRSSAEQLDADGLTTLGLTYYFGNGVPQDYKEATKWFQKAAAQGNVDAQYYLGTCYGNGDGVEKDSVEAVMWLSKAAKQGDMRAQYYLGASYCDGTGVEKNEVEGVNWKRKAAAQGLADAQYGVGSAYFNGQGVARNYVQAYMWMSLALAQGNATAGKYMPVVEQKLTPEQIAEAQELAREFKPHKETGSANSTSPQSPRATGTGFLITDDGYLISNYLC